MLAINGTGDLLPGDIGFHTIAGRVGGWVSIGQALLRDECWLTHAFLVLDGGECIEARPGGAWVAPLAGRFGPGYGYARLPLDAGQRAGIDGARDLDGTPYSFADYGALAAKRLGVPTPLLRSYITSSGHMICSQLVDHGITKYGRFQVFDDGRLHQDVTPGALFRRSGVIGDVMWW